MNFIYNFDEPIERSNTNSIKFDYAAKRGKPSDAYPMWVADMDFRSPPCVIEALAERAAHGVFGYSDTDERYDAALTNWFRSRYKWTVDPRWNAVTCGVVPSVYLAVRAFTQPGDGVIVQPPVYYPFFGAVSEQGRTLLENPLVLSNGRYEINFDELECLAPSAKLLILCSPHNPVGRVWTRGELTRLGEICLRYGVTVVSDEIHADFVYGAAVHTPFAAISPELSDICVTCTAPSKTFNLAGLQLANIVISDKTLRSSFRAEYSRAGLSQGSLFGMTACRAAYERGGEWLDALLLYLRDNISAAREYFSNGAIKLIEPEGTYLIWLDCRDMRLSDAELDAKFLNEYKLWLDHGTMFGTGGSGFTRMNIALPKAKLRECLNKIR